MVKGMISYSLSTRAFHKEVLLKTTALSPHSGYQNPSSAVLDGTCLPEKEDWFLTLREEKNSSFLESQQITSINSFGSDKITFPSLKQSLGQEKWTSQGPHLELGSSVAPKPAGWKEKGEMVFPKVVQNQNKKPKSQKKRFPVYTSIKEYVIEIIKQKTYLCNVFKNTHKATLKQGE